jgi:2,4-dienoyl-CoA reductase-like NADH-dependent reductase (Old Yellow Enzyme family)/thioredoxin reductase
MRIPNRFMSTSHAPGYASGGHITERYVLYETEKAKGGVGLVQFGGATAMSPENSFKYGQINGGVDEIIPEYQRMASAIHEHGAVCTIQLAHGGRRERWDSGNWLPAFAPSCTRELIHRVFPAEIEDHDIRRLCEDYAAAGRRARLGNIDGIEISCQAGTLIEQFWSPAMNFRDDEYGGSLENRMRFGFEVLQAMRDELGDDYPVGIRMPGDEMMAGGLSQEDCTKIARAHAESGLVDFISVVGGQAYDYKASAKIWPTMWVPSAAYLGMASGIKSNVKVPVFHATRITDAATAAHAVKEGLIDMVGMTRAFIADPHHVRKLREGLEDDIRPCVGAGYCVDRVLRGTDALCCHNVVTSREGQLSHKIHHCGQPAKRVVVVGGGPGGLEAARVAAHRGHEVILLEASAELGGQLVLAGKTGWRRDLSGIIGWLEKQMKRLGVTVHLNTLASCSDVEALSPDEVIIACGGLPNVGDFAGNNLTDTTWDVFSGQRPPGDDVLVFDEHGGHGALACAELLAKGGARVTLATPDRATSSELGDTNIGAHMSELYGHGVTIQPDTRLTAVERDGNGLLAALTNLYSEQSQRMRVDQVVSDCGTLPNDELYFELKPLSSNLGEVDLRVLAAGAPQTVIRNPDGRFALYRIGDAWAGRNIHAAMLDAMRICRNL